MIDHPERVTRLLDKLQPVLPLPARMTPELVATLAKYHKGITPACTIVAVNYAGDEAGLRANWLAQPSARSRSTPRSPTSASTRDCRRRETFLSIKSIA